METSSQPAHGATPPATPGSADHPTIRAGEWRTVFYSFAVLNLVTIAVSFWFMVRVAELDDPLVHAAALQKFEYSIAALGLLVVGSILRGLRVGRQSEAQHSQHLVAQALYAASQQDLELTVSARTRELANANDFLLAEIAERERAERRLRQTEERFQLLSQATHDCVWDWDLEKDTLWFNDAMRELLGHGASHTANMEWWAGNLHASDRERVMQGLQQAIGGGRRLWADEFRFHRGDGAYAYVLNRGYVVRNDDGHALRLISAMTDLSQRRRAEEELRQAKEAAESANRAKSEFVANVSHEIRTPMNGVLGMLELALGTELTPEQREYLKLARNSADALLRVINGILDFSKIEAGHLQLETISFSLRSTLEDIAGAFALEAESKGLELNCEVASEIPDKLLGDPGRLRQILINLMGNSLKFTERGHVTVRVAEEAPSENALRSGNQNEVRLQFAVSDSGIGVAPEKQQLIFDAFKQADGSTTRRYGGTGLGLAISRQLVELMAGRIWLESSPAVGSIFRFTAAFRVAEAPAAALPQPTDLRGVRALVVEDQAGRHEALDAFERWGMLPTLVRGTAEALAALRQASERSIPFPLVVMDLHMPEVEGFRLVERIQQETQFADPRVILLTSAGRRGDGARCRELGIAAYLSKPIRQAELLQALQLALGRQQTNHDPSRTLITRHSLRERRVSGVILLAEDNPVNQKLALTLLAKRGYTVRVAGNGREAVRLWQQGSCDLILMDVQMPEMDGLEATALIRQQEQPSGRHIPIIAMTAHAMTGDRERCLHAGMDGYLSKPIQSQLLFDAIEDLLPAAAAAPATTATAESLPLLDKEALLAHVGDDIGLLREMVEIFNASAPVLLEQAAAALAAGDADGLHRATHALKGAASNFAAAAACQAAIELDELAQSGRLEPARGALAALASEIGRLRLRLAELAGFEQAVGA